MTDQNRTNQALMEEISTLKQRIRDLEQSLSKCKRVEEALQKSEEKFLELLEHINDIFYEVDKQGTIQYCSPSVEDLLGYSQAEIIGRSINDFLDAEDRFSAIENVQRVISGHTAPREYRIRCRSGENRWIRVYSNPVRKGDQILGIRGIMSDITKRKRVEQEAVTLAEIGRVISSTLDIKEVYEQFASITGNLIPFDSLSVNLIDVQNNMFRIAYNSGLDLPGRKTGLDIPITGTMTEYVMHKKKPMMFNVSSVDEMTRLYPGITAVLSIHAGFHSNMLIPLLAKDAIIGVLHFRAMKQNAYSGEDVCLAERIGGQIAGAIANAQLFSNLSKTENSLRESEAKFRGIYEESPIGIEIYDHDGKLLDINKPCLEIFGIPDASAVRGFRLFEDPNLSEELKAQLRRGENVRYEIPFDFERVTAFKLYETRKSGTIYLDLLITPFGGAAKESIIGYLVHVRDITESKQAEEEKLSLEDRLQRSEKMEALGQLASGVAHDLNNVLGILSGYSELLLAEIPEGSRSRGHVEKILQSTEKGAAIIQDLLAMTGRGIIASSMINLNSVVQDFLKAPIFDKLQSYHPHVTFMTECDKNLLNIKGDSIHLEKTIMNLLSNAAESISGNGAVIIQTENRYLDKPVHGYDTVKEGDYAVLKVSDTGTGIPAENIKKIFEPFYTKKTLGRSGTGLGLAIVWGTVKDHNGYIDVQTEKGQGTTFTLYFPVVREEKIAPEQKVQIEKYMGNGESVLVVDDVAEQREIAAGLLTRLGYEVHVVSSGEEAVDYLKSNKADILVLDMIMTPGIDGLETYQRVLEINPRQKAILFSGFSKTERVREAQKLGIGAYVKKPYMIEKIGMAVRKELDRK